jgi:hypothetical protein
MIRRDLLKSMATLVGAPALPAVAGGFPRLGTTPIHTEAEFRAAFETYIAHYTAFFTPYTEPDFDGYNEESVAKKRLLAMTMGNNGYCPEECAPGVASVSVDLGDVQFVVAGDPDCEGLDSGGSIVVIVPRTQAIFDRLNTLPTWDRPPGRHFPPSTDPDEYDTLEGYHARKANRESRAGAAEDEDDGDQQAT